MTAAGGICVSLQRCEDRQRNRSSPLKISLIKDRKSPTSLVPHLPPPPHISWTHSLCNYSGKECFYLARFRLSRLAKESASMQTRFFLCVFLPSFSLSVLVSFICLSAALLQIFYAWINWKPRRIYHTLAPIFPSGHRGGKKISSYMHSLRRYCRLAQFQSRYRRQRRVYWFRQGCEHSGTWFRQMFLGFNFFSSWTDPV